MGKRWLACAVLLCCSVAVAQTGGSMGGGDWSSSGGGGGGGGGGYSSGGGGYSSGGGGGGYSSDYNSGGGGWSSSGGGGGGSMPIGFFVVMLGLFVVVALFAVRSQQSPDFSLFDSNDLYTPPATDAVDVSVLRIAIDARARKFVQTELKRIAGIANTATAEGRATMLREVALLLRKLRDAWVYGGAVNEPMQSIGEAKPLFDSHVDDARSRFREETIRNEQGSITRGAASEYRPRGDEGQGLILVTLVIAARRELFTVSRIGNGDDLRAALEAASQLAPTTLVAIEIVWQPSEDEDRLSSMELEAKYPSPQIIPIQNALVGKTFCTYCGGPFPAELVSCPHCGAPAPGREKAAA